MLVHVRRPAGMGRRGGFTLVELLVVIGIIALLMSILLPTLGRVRERSNMIKCLSNLREVTRGWLLYAQNNRDFVPHPMTGPLTRYGPGCWVMDGATDSAIIDGSIYPYVNNVALYKCPSDTLARNRSYTVNDYWGGAWGTYDPYRVRKLSESRRKSDVFVFLEEWDRRNGFAGFNQGSFVVDVYPGWEWVDYPAFFHSKSTNFSFADGHAENIVWGNPDTLLLGTIPGRLGVNYVAQPNNMDLREVQRISGLRNFPNP